MMQPVKALADSVRGARQPVSDDNPLLAMERAASTWITSGLEAYGELRDRVTETMFLNTYGSPLLQAMVGLGTPQATPHQVERDLLREAREAQLRVELERRFESGGAVEAALRGLVYIRLADGSVDERGFAALRLIRASQPAARRMSMARFKEILREQYLLVRLDEDRALAALPQLLGADEAVSKGALEALRQVLAARGDLSDDGARRLARVEGLFGTRSQKAARAEAARA